MQHAEVIVFPDSEKIVIDYLKAAYVDRGETAEIHRSVPDPMPTKLTTVRRSGGVPLNIVVDAPRMVIECWAPTPGEAADLCLLTRALITAMRGRVIGGVTVGVGEEAGGPVDFPDPQSRRARYTYSPVLHLRGTAI